MATPTTTKKIAKKVAEPAAEVKLGRKPKPPEEKFIKKTVSFHPETYRGLLIAGSGVLSRGIEVLYQQATQKASKAKS